MGIKPDKEAAAILGRSVRAVIHRRGKLGLPPVRGPRQPRPNDWKPAEIALLGVINDKELAQRFGRKLNALRKYRRKHGIGQPNPLFRPWTAREEKLLGNKPDREVAKLLGRTATAVAAHRKKLQILAPASG